MLNGGSLKSGSVKLGPTELSKDDLNQVITKIDAHLNGLNSKNLGIKFGADVFDALVKAGKIKKAVFSVLGTGAFPMELPAYDGTYAAWRDWELGDWEVEFGTPA
ncbi:hypothetical protein [Microvirga sp. G4-2]|uniref:hypothetical protein n=1 Tax=Microvirga sp. G4-2 TaxID=3434467 RepID=UPI004044B870